MTGLTAAGQLDRDAARADVMWLRSSAITNVPDRYERALDALEAAERRAADLIAAVDALADSLEWRRPDVSPCAPDFACCGSELSCDAMQPSVKVVGAQAIRDVVNPFRPTLEETS